MRHKIEAPKGRRILGITTYDNLPKNKTTILLETRKGILSKILRKKIIINGTGFKVVSSGMNREGTDYLIVSTKIKKRR